MKDYWKEREYWKTTEWSIREKLSGPLHDLAVEYLKLGDKCYIHQIISGKTLNFFKETSVICQLENP